MRKCWREVTLGDVVELIPGKYVPKSEYVDDGPFFIYGSNSVMGKYSKALINVPHTVMAAIGNAGAVRYSPEPSWVNNNAFGLVANSETEPKFLFLWLENILDLKSVVAGTVQPYVQRPLLKAVRIKLPSQLEQKRIVDLVSSVDSYIAALQKQADAAHAARSAVLSELLSAGSEDWTPHNLGDIATLCMGRTPSRNNADYWTTELTYPFCTIADMEGPSISPSREGVTQRAINDGKARVAPAGSLLMSFKLTIGRVGFAARDLYPNEAIVVIEPDEKKATREFLYYQLGSMDLTGGSGRAVKGLTLNSSSLAGIRLSIPSLAIQQRIVDLVSSMDDMIETTRQAISNVRRTRAGLLFDLLSGEHEIPESYDRLLGAA